MKPLPPADAQLVQAAQGWLELGDNPSAIAELEKIAPANREHPLVLEVRFLICSVLKDWETGADVARAFVKAVPEVPEGWIQLAVVLHELKCTREAVDLLLSVAGRFPKDWLIPYNLACYCVHLGDFLESQRWLKSALSIDPVTVKRLAMEDSNLKPVWESMANTN